MGIYKLLLKIVAGLANGASAEFDRRSVNESNTTVDLGIIPNPVTESTDKVWEKSALLNEESQKHV